MPYATSREWLENELSEKAEYMVSEGYPAVADVIRDALALLKEQNEEIESLKQTAQSMMEGICLLKEQDAIEGTVEETRSEWPDEALPLSRNETREYPVDNSGRNKA